MKFIIIAVIVVVSAAGYFAADALQNERGEEPPRGNALEKFDAIRATSPQSNALLKTPLAVEGEARGFWFTGDSLPVVVLDAKGNVLGQALAHALSEPETEEFVDFEGAVHFGEPETENGFVIVAKNNPSGLLENADGLIIPVRFAE